MSDLAKEKAARLLKKRGSLSSLGSHEVRAKEAFAKTKDSISTVSYMEEPGHHDDIPRPAVQMENSYQLSPARRFPVLTVKDILKDVLTSYLQEEKYEPELCRQMTKTISEHVLLFIGQIRDQNMRMGSRCLWDETHDNFSSHTFKNSSLFAAATVYGVYFE
uniref:Tctex1 domain-containing protein 1 n=1 Tax=Sinocyclocheilus rhinocerous TaxID=307959 RepID=A0A673G0I3_9TELE